MKKKFLTAVLTLAMTASFAACNTTSTNDNPDVNPNTAPEVHSDTATDIVTDTDRKPLASDLGKSPVDTDILTDTEILTESDILTDTDIETDTDTETADNNSITIDPSDIDIGGYTLSAQLIPFDTPLEVTDSNTVDGAVFGDTLYLLDRKKILEYSLNGESADLTNENELNSKYARIDADCYGQIYLCNDVFNIAKLESDSTLTELDLTGDIALSKLQEFGLTYLGGSDNILAYLNGETSGWGIISTDTDTATDELSDNESESTDEVIDTDTPKKLFSSIKNIEFVGNHIMVGGDTADKESLQMVAVYDYDGNLIAITEDKTPGNSIDAMTETDNGYIIATAGNISLWNLDGSAVGKSTSNETATLFGTPNNVRIDSLFAQDDGSVLALCTAERDDGKYEALLYSLTGF